MNFESLNTNKLSRRTFLKAVGTSAALAALQGPGVIAGTKTFSGLTFDYWSMNATQNPLVLKSFKKGIEKFEQRTGAKVNFTPVTPEDIYGPKFATAVKTNNLPICWDASGRLATFYPWSISLEKFIKESPGLEERIGWAIDFELKSQTAIPPEKRKIMDLPFALWHPGWVGRMDHLEKAGIDPDKEFPPRSLAHWLSLGRRLKEAGVTKYPLAIYGASGDVLDLLFANAIVAQGVGPKKKPYPYWDESWRESNINEDVYRATLEIWRAVMEMELVGPYSPAYSDEKMCNALAAGTNSLSMTDSSNRGLLMDRAPQLVKDGTIRWGANFDLGSGYSAWGVMQNIHIAKLEKSRSKSKEAQRAAFELGKELLKDENVTAIAKPFGLAVPKTAWDDLTPSPDNYFEYQINNVESGRVASKLEPPRWEDFIYGAGPPIMSKFYRGKISAAEAQKQLYKACDKILKEQTFPWE